MSERSPEELMEEAREGLGSIYEATLRIFEVPYDEKTKKPLPREQPMTKDEQERILERVNKRIKSLQKTTDSIRTELNMSQDEVKHFLENPDNFTPEQWEILQTMRSQLQSYRQQVLETLGITGSGKVPVAKKKPSVKKKFKRSKWLQG